MSIALFTAVSGLNNFQGMLDVVADNISNMNTTGFKASRVNFQSLMSETHLPATAPRGDMGGRNPIQTGLGSTIGSIDRVFRQGALEQTGSNTDLAITGDGFFIVGDGSINTYTRNGHFTVDTAGDLVDSQGHYVQGWQAVDGVVDPDGQIGKVNIPLGEQMIAKVTENVKMAGNLDASSGVYSAGPPATGGQYTTEMTVYDDIGGAYKVPVTFTRVTPGAGVAAAWDWTADFGGSTVGSGTVAFDANGLYDPTNSTGTPVTLTPTNSANPFSVDLDFGGMTQFVTNGEYSVLPTSQDGFPAGTLLSFDIDQQGVITGRFTNGQLRAIGQVGMAFFANPKGLQGSDGGRFLESANSGVAQIGVPGSGPRGSLNPGSLEMSNVDLTGEFSKMILAQRAFQANSKVVTTMDEILNEVNNLKR
ncbi:MAG: flagellar hook protein FlgE [Candidatus Eremiobacteraeota bacterium]|nr:flagellar hook protein FlgE [Candidatus Eremiobacteraeota bacterium]